MYVPVKLPAGFFAAGLALLLGCGGGSRAAQPAPARASSSSEYAPDLASRWWESAGACEEGTLLGRTGADPQRPDDCAEPICEVWCERVDGTRHGRVTGWYVRTGKKHHEGSYRAGKKHGPWVVWYLGGEMSDHGAYADGEKQGFWTQWWEGGALYREVEFARGKVVAITPYEDGKPMPAEHVEVEGAGLAKPAPAEEPEPPADEPPSHADYLGAVRAAFPEAYAELAKVTYESMGEDSFGIDAVTVLIPEVHVQGLSKAELAERACKAKKLVGLDCACETVELAPAQDYAWHSWPDKRVVPLTLKFFVAC